MALYRPLSDAFLPCWIPSRQNRTHPSHSIEPFLDQLVATRPAASVDMCRHHPGRPPIMFHWSLSLPFRRYLPGKVLSTSVTGYPSATTYTIHDQTLLIHRLFSAVPTCDSPSLLSKEGREKTQTAGSTGMNMNPESNKVMVTVLNGAVEPVAKHGPVSLSTSSNPERWVGVLRDTKGWSSWLAAERLVGGRRPIAGVIYATIDDASEQTYSTQTYWRLLLQLAPSPQGLSADASRERFELRKKRRLATTSNQKINVSEPRIAQNYSVAVDPTPDIWCRGQACLATPCSMSSLCTALIGRYPSSAEKTSKKKSEAEYCMAFRSGRVNSISQISDRRKVGGYGRGSELLCTQQDRDGGRGDAPRTMPASCFAFYAYDDGQALRELKASSSPQQGRRSGPTILACLLSGSWAGCLTHDVYLMVEAMARWHGWEWEHGAANTCRSGTEATPHRRRSTPDPTNDSFDNGTPKAKDAAKSSVGAPEFAPAPDEFTVAWGHGSYVSLAGWLAEAEAGKSQSCPRTPLFSAAYLDPNFADISDLSQRGGPFVTSNPSSLRTPRSWEERRCGTFLTDTLPTTADDRPRSTAIPNRYTYSLAHQARNMGAFEKTEAFHFACRLMNELQLEKIDFVRSRGKRKTANAYSVLRTPNDIPKSQHQSTAANGAPQYSMHHFLLGLAMRCTNFSAMFSPPDCDLTGNVVQGNEVHMGFEAWPQATGSLLHPRWYDPLLTYVLHVMAVARSIILYDFPRRSCSSKPACHNCLPADPANCTESRTLLMLHDPAEIAETATVTSAFVHRSAGEHR
ncbi:uncharacterized protein CLUP02_13585 [Colletotrichum lupini]|uniref:Uncharacterized protein n=1 Tax=Colletotrichum lupini TaxID=145971 RepID=A0A9Q8T2Q0_9PEZI|nr:uncharacterized protein CLUP02_13585 [Colletotrichum lupini]UQC88063.1 hypothetical protein CLUP02_13585 [Colletotrichum lupini]